MGRIGRWQARGSPQANAMDEAKAIADAFRSTNFTDKQWQDLQPLFDADRVMPRASQVPAIGAIRKLSKIQAAEAVAQVMG